MAEALHSRTLGRRSEKELMASVKEIKLGHEEDLIVRS